MGHKVLRVLHSDLKISFYLLKLIQMIRNLHEKWNKAQFSTYVF